MFAKGVTCSDCHDIHSLELKAPGDAVCGPVPPAVQVRDPAAPLPQAGSSRGKLPGLPHAEEHQIHGGGSPTGSQLACAPTRPHVNHWITEHLQLGRLPPRQVRTMGGDHDGRLVRGGLAQTPLRRSAVCPPGVDSPVREVGSSAWLKSRDAWHQCGLRRFPTLERFADGVSLTAIEGALSDDDPLVRRAALTAIAQLPPGQRLAALPLFDDPIRAVRVEAARLLAPVPDSELTPEELAVLERGLVELEEALMVDADRAEAHMTLGGVNLDRQRFEDAEAAYRTALPPQPTLWPGGCRTFRDLYRQQGRDAEGERVLVDFLTRNPEEGVVHHSLGLLLARNSSTTRPSSSLPGRQA